MARDISLTLGTGRYARWPRACGRVVVFLVSADWGSRYLAGLWRGLPAEHPGSIPDPADRPARTGNPAGVQLEFCRPGGSRADAGLGPDAARLGNPVRRTSAVVGDRTRCGY